MELPNDLDELADFIEEMEAQFERAKDFDARKEARKQYYEAAKKYNNVAGRNVYKEKL